MTPAEAQEVLNRAFEGGLFEKPLPKGYGDYWGAEKTFRREQIRELLGVRGFISDRVDVEGMSYGGGPPTLRGFRPGWPDAESRDFWRCALWQKFLDDLGAPTVDWEKA